MKKQTRVLLADEVGLGKTIIAKAVIDKVAEWHRIEGDDHFKVIYICSNINIANQNYRKLTNNSSEFLNISDSRLSMQHLKIYQNKGTDHEYKQLIPMTPATSFSMSSGQGMYGERALLYVFLRRHKDLFLYQQRLSNLLKFDKNLKYWDDSVKWYESEVEKCNVNSPDYIPRMIECMNQFINDSLYDDIVAYCKSEDDAFENYSKRREIISKLRRAFAELSLNELEPDLVIMDEFQRFKDLLIDRDDESMLKKFLKEQSSSSFCYAI